MIIYSRRVSCDVETFQMMKKGMGAAYALEMPSKFWYMMEFQRFLTVMRIFLTIMGMLLQIMNQMNMKQKSN